MESKIDLIPSKPSIDDFALAATELGQGNFSVVYRATHRATGNAFALKRIDKAAMKKIAIRQPNVQREILQEKQVGGRLGGVWTCQLHRTWTDADALYLLYDLAQDGELWGTRLVMPLLQDCPTPRIPVPMDEMAAAAVMCVLVRALAHLHGHGVVHRDLKPENAVLDAVPSNSTGATGAGDAGIEDEVVTVSYRGLTCSARLSSPSWPFPCPTRLRLIDTGSAKDMLLTGHNNPASDCAGTPEYMGPEVIRPRQGTGHSSGGAATVSGSGGASGTAHPVDTSADLWSAGAVAYRLLAGCAPFAAPSPYLTMQRAVEYTGPGRCRCGGQTATVSGTMPAGADDGGCRSEGCPDGLLYPPGLSPQARDFVSALLRPDPLDRLGCTGRWPGFNRGQGLDRSNSDAHCGRPPGWDVAQEVREEVQAEARLAGRIKRKDDGAADGGPGDVGHAAARHGPGRPTPKLVPPVTAPCSIDHGRLLRHPWLAGMAGQTRDDMPLIPALRPDARHVCLLSLAQALATMPAVSAGQLRGLMEGTEADPADNPALAWQSLWRQVQSLPPPDRTMLAHLLALRHRLTVPHVWCCLWASYACARGARLVVLEQQGQGLHGEAVPEDGSASDSGMTPEHWAYRQVGPYGPRHALTWACAPTTYHGPDESGGSAKDGAGTTSEATAEPAAQPPEAPGTELNSLGWRAVHANEWPGQGYVVFLPDPWPEVDSAADASPHPPLDRPSLVQAFVAAVSCLHPAPRAVVVMGQTGGPLVVTPPITTADGTDGTDAGFSAVHAPFCGRQSPLCEALAGLAHPCMPILTASSDRGHSTKASRAGEDAGWPSDAQADVMLSHVDAAFGATVSGVRLLMVRPSAALAHVGHRGWLASQLGSSAGSQHGVIVAGEPLHSGDNGTRGNTGSISGALAAQCLSNLLSRHPDHGVRYVVCPAGDGGGFTPTTYDADAGRA